MKKETIVTAIVFLVVGFFAGYIAEAEFNWNAPEARAHAPFGGGGATAEPTESSTGASPGMTGAASSMASGAAGQMRLPEGHPPLDDAALVKALENQAAQNPKDSEPPLRLANYYYDHRQFEHAAEWYERALALDAKNVSARTDLGTVYFNLGRPRDALAEYQKTLQLDPSHEPTMFNIIIVNLEGTRDLAAARAAWERLHQKNPNYPGLGELKDQLGAAERAKSNGPRMP